MPAISPKERFFLVSTAWLQSWVNGIATSNALDMSNCHIDGSSSDVPSGDRNMTLYEEDPRNMLEACSKHSNCTSGICPYNVKKYKFVSRPAYALLLPTACENNEGSLCSKDVLCINCVDEICESSVKLQKNVEIVDDILTSITENSISDVDDYCQDLLAYCISKDSISELKKLKDRSKKFLDRIRQELEGGLSKNGLIAFHLETASIDACALEKLTEINASLLCEHGLPRSNFFKKSVIVSGDAWRTLVEKYSTSLRWKDIGAHQTECGTCLVASTTNLELERVIREERFEETNSKELRELFVRKKRYPPVLECMVPFYGIQNNRKLKSLKETYGESGYIHYRLHFTHELIYNSVSG